MKSNFWCNKRVFITGHTGFKGSWLALWLQKLGANIIGYALDPPTTPNLFTVAGVADKMTSMISDIRHLTTLQQALQATQPEIVLHLAAQPLVRLSYQQPVDTYTTNILGTLNLLEAIRSTPSVRVMVNVTSDKCYENREWLWGYRENEALGGSDPYSSSKACSELITTAYRRSFFTTGVVALASARAGNVIGGGDWAEDRLVPDILRALEQHQPLIVRYPQAVRPWQHVLEPLAGYLRLAECLYEKGQEFACAWNFGPDEQDSQTVSVLLNYFSQQSPDFIWHADTQAQPHEASLLKLDSSQARQYLGWQPRWHISQALHKTWAWHQAWQNKENMQTFCLQQIEEYEQS